MITQEELKQILHYDPDTGKWTWLISKRGYRGISVGDEAGNASHERGYRSICIDGVRYPSTHLANLYMTGEWPENTMDHEDNDPTNDAWSNLRPADASQQQWNQRTPRNNTSGVKGVSYIDGQSGNKKWRGSICMRGKRIFRHFYTFDEAVAWRKTAEQQHHGEFTNGT